VFDCDGLLVDSGGSWVRAYRAVAAAHGRTLAAVDLRALDGASVAHACARLRRDLGVPVEESALREALREAFAAAPPEPLPGARSLVRALAARGPVAVASNAPRDLVVGVLDRLGLRDLLTAIVSGEETPAPKPAPDVYLEACARLAVAPSDAIAFEDSGLGARAARAAGLIVVAVPSARGARIDADLTVPRLDDRRLAAYLDLPAARGGASA
jgi:HAD superfamily hydrolase (TIGR01509 family)